MLASTQTSDLGISLLPHVVDVLYAAGEFAVFLEEFVS
jgi:hypothetical protein